LLTACTQPSPPSPPPPPTPSPATAGTTAARSVNLLNPGAARAGLNQLMVASGGSQAIRVTVTSALATLTYVTQDTAHTLQWDSGTITEIDSDVTYVGQTAFSLATFDLDDIGRFFAQAAALTGSSSRQELQINEFNNGRVLMTVTTTPESQTIFFRPDGSIIDWLSFTMAAGIREGLSDVTDGTTEVVAIGLTDQGLYADVAVSPTVIERRTRPTRLPAYSAQRTATALGPAFDPSLVDPYVVARLLSAAPADAARPDTTATMSIDAREGGPPLIHINVGLASSTYTLAGEQIIS